MSRSIARQARDNPDHTALYVVGGVVAVALGAFAIVKLTAAPASASTTPTSPTTPPSTTTPAPSTTTTPSTPGSTLSPSIPTVVAAPVSVGAQAYISAASLGMALPWRPPAGAVAASPSGITPTSEVTDSALVAMAQHALYLVGQNAGQVNASSQVTAFPMTGVTGRMDAATKAALLRFQTWATSPGSFLLSGTTQINTSGTLDYKTLGALLFIALFLFVKASGMTEASDSGLDAPLLSLSTSGLARLVSLGRLTTTSSYSQLYILETDFDVSTGSNGNLFYTKGVMNWQGWALCVGVGA